jgi:hypothetical protein
MVCERDGEGVAALERYVVFCKYDAGAFRVVSCSFLAAGRRSQYVSQRKQRLTENFGKCGILIINGGSSADYSSDTRGCDAIMGIATHSRSSQFEKGRRELRKASMRLVESKASRSEMGWRGLSSLKRTCALLDAILALD